MEAVVAPNAPDQSTSPSPSHYKQMKTPTKRSNTARGFVSRPSENMIPARTNIHGGLLFAPPPSLSLSYPPSIYNSPHSAFNSQQAPPLLPLPVSKPPALPSRSKSLSFPPTTRKPTSRARDQSLTPKKSSKQPNKPKEEPTKQYHSEIGESLVTAPSAVPILGPDPKNLPKDVCKILMTSTSVAGNNNNNVIINSTLFGLKDLEKFSGSVFTPSPPPSSLPLPKFFIRPKLSCTAEAAENIDIGATDNLRRLLRLR